MLRRKSQEEAERQKQALVAEGSALNYGYAGLPIGQGRERSRRLQGKPSVSEGELEEVALHR